MSGIYRKALRELGAEVVQIIFGLAIFVPLVWAIWRTLTGA